MESVREEIEIMVTDLQFQVTCVCLMDLDFKIYIEISGLLSIGNLYEELKQLRFNY